MVTKKVKTIGVIGLGSIGSRHATNLWKELGQTEVIGYDPDPARHKGWTCGDLDFLLKMADMVVIASPTSMHENHFIESRLVKGIPTFLEKPCGGHSEDSAPSRRTDIAQEMIVTSHLTLTPPSSGSVTKVVGWLNDLEVVRYSEQRHRKHYAETQQIYIGMMVDPHQYMEIHYGNALIGTISAHVDEPNSVADVGILIGERKVWGKGFGTEAWKAFCDHLLGTGIRKIEAGCMATNFGMIHVFRKTGMHEEGRRSGHFLVGNELVDITMWARFL